MTPPSTSPTPSRLNAGGYGVRVTESRRLELPLKTSLLTAAEYVAAMLPSFRESGGKLRRCSDGIYATVSAGHGTVAPDGSLSIKPEPWAARHYRRAVMGGAGVYRLGLWAMLAGRRAQLAPARLGEGAALNMAGNIGARFIMQPRQLSPTEQAELDRWIDDLGRDTPQRTRRRYGPTRFAVRECPGLRLIIKASKEQCRKQRVSSSRRPWGDKWASAQALQRTRIEKARERAQRTRPALSLKYRAHLARLTKRGDLYRAYIARRVKAQRPPARIPRPLHAHPRPPAAPLAPPAPA